MRELAPRGWEVMPLDLPAGFPRPDLAARAQSTRLLAALPDSTLVVADQICFSPLADQLAREARRLRLVMIFHHPIARELGLPLKTRGLMRHSEESALASCRLVVTTSPTTAEALRTDYNVPEARVVVALPGIQRFEPAGLPQVVDVLKLLSVGAVIERKGYHILLDALSGLRDLRWQLDIVGDLDRAPDYVSRLQARIAAAGLSDRIVLRGGISASELEACWQSAHGYVTASVHEGYGMAIAEAIARGIPTVTSHAGAVGEWLDPNAALIVPSGAREALRDAIGRVLTEPLLRSELRAAALAQARKFPSWSDAAAVVDQALRDL
jgi:glycosyltransferase involved in cell wall biosynthesis